MDQVFKINLEWSTNDVIDRAEENDISLTFEQARDILMLVEKNHDANEGVTWDVLDFWTDHLLREG